MREDIYFIYTVLLEAVMDPFNIRILIKAKGYLAYPVFIEKSFTFVLFKSGK